MWPLQYCEEMSFMLSSHKCVVHRLCGLCASVPQGVSLPPRHMEGAQSSVSSYVVSSNGRSKRGTKRWREYFSCKRSPTSLISFKAWERDHSISAEETDARKLSAHLHFCMPTDHWQQSRISPGCKSVGLEVCRICFLFLYLEASRPSEQHWSFNWEWPYTYLLDYSNSKART